MATAILVKWHYAPLSRVDREFDSRMSRSDYGVEIAQFPVKELVRV